MSKTRSGLVYKEDDTKDTKDTMAELKVQELLQMLIEDRKKREMEISEERERRKKEFEAVRRSRGPEITVKLVPLNEKDDVEAYLVTFERIMAAHNISKDSGNYEKIKAAILIRYGINDEEYRRRFRSERRKDGETNRELAVRLMEWQPKWLKECHTVEDVLNAAGELADEYEQARRPEMETLASSTSKPNRVGSRECHYCGKSGHAEEDCYKRKREESQRSRGIQCYHCKKQGHMSWECPEKSMVCKERMDWRRKGGKPMYKTGKVEGQKVTDILLDTGCSRTMVRRNLVAIEKVIVGRVATITCAHGDTKLHPLALVEVELDGSHIQVEAALSEELPVSVLLGTDVPELTHLISGTGSSINLVSQEQVMVVLTRAKAKQKLEEELIRKEKSFCLVHNLIHLFV
ncbi:hypothetical protein EMCRGX_G012724 [Ephydatia muelleri]